MSTRPPVGSTILNRVLIKVDLPQPVLPTMPIFSLGLMVSDKPLRTRSKSSLYRTCRLWNVGKLLLPTGWGRLEGQGPSAGQIRAGQGWNRNRAGQGLSRCNAGQDSSKSRAGQGSTGQSSRAGPKQDRIGPRSLRGSVEKWHYAKNVRFPH